MIRCTIIQFVMVSLTALVLLNLLSGGELEVVNDTIPPARTEYLGRTIAPTMSYQGAPWLIRKERQEEENCELMLKNLGVKPGMTVCDMGCGNGFYALQLARLVGDNGKVLAVDIQPEMLTLLRARAKNEGVENIIPTLGSLVDPELPVGEVDLILCVDVYHEFSHPERMLRAMHRALSAKGRVVLVEFREEDPTVPIKPLHKMSKQQVVKELSKNDFHLAHQFDNLPWQHMLFFAADREVNE